MDVGGASKEPLLIDAPGARSNPGDRPISPALNCGPSGCVLTLADEDDPAFKERDSARRKLTAAICLSFIFMGVEIAGGLLANSLAIMTDAAHLLSDIAGFALSLFAIWMAGWEATPRHTFGYHRVEILGALLSVQLIWMITGIIVYEAIVRLLYNTGDVNGRTMFITASFGVGVNVLMAMLFSHNHGLGGHDHGHDHGHSHGGDGHGHGHSTHGGHHHEPAAPLARQDSERRWWKQKVKDKDDRRGCTTLSPASSLPNLQAAGHSHKQSGGHAHKHGDNHTKGHSHKHADKDHLHEHSGSHSHRHDEEEGGHSGENHAHVNGPQGDDVIVCVCSPPEDCICTNAAGKPVMRRRLSSQYEAPSVVEENINLRGAYLHVLGDLVQSVGVMIAGAIIWVKPEWRIVDLVCTLLFSLLVLYTTVKIVRDIVGVLMESTPRAINAAELEMRILRLDDVVDVHDLHIWAITMGKTMLACHVRINPDADTDKVLSQVSELCEKRYKIGHVTIQVEKSSSN